MPGYEDFTTGSQAVLFFHFVMSQKGAVAQYPPGAALLAAPLYAVSPNKLREVILHRPANPEVPSVKILLPSFWQATAIAVISTAAAIAFLGLIFFSQGSPKEAWIASWLAGLGTSAWSIASDMLWQHGPAMLWIALGLFMSLHRHWWLSGLAFGAGVLTRPHTAVIPVCVGLACAFNERSFLVIWKLGLAAFSGLVILVVYNYFVFGSLSIASGYDSAIRGASTNLIKNLFSADIMFFLKNFFGGMFDLRVGLLVWSPFLVLLIPGILQGWRQSDWVFRSAIISGLIYLFLQFKMIGYKPGFVIPYRYPLEGLTASAPLLFASYLYWVKCRPQWRNLLVKTSVLSVGFQAIAVYYF